MSRRHFPAYQPHSTRSSHPLQWRQPHRCGYDDLGSAFLLPQEFSQSIAHGQCRGHRHCCHTFLLARLQSIPLHLVSEHQLSAKFSLWKPKASLRANDTAARLLAATL